MTGTTALSARCVIARGRPGTMCRLCSQTSLLGLRLVQPFGRTSDCGQRRTCIRLYADTKSHSAAKPLRSSRPQPRQTIQAVSLRPREQHVEPPILLPVRHGRQRRKSQLRGTLLTLLGAPHSEQLRRDYELPTAPAKGRLRAAGARRNGVNLHCSISPTLGRELTHMCSSTSVRHRTWIAATAPSSEFSGPVTAEPRAGRRAAGAQWRPRNPRSRTER
jgi:hypothetical protein